MKKIFYILLAMMFSFTLTSCGGGGEEMGEADEMEMKEEATDMVEEAAETAEPAPEEKAEEGEMETEEEKAEGM